MENKKISLVTSIVLNTITHPYQLCTKESVTEVIVSILNTHYCITDYGSDKSLSHELRPCCLYRMSDDVELCSDHPVPPYKALWIMMCYAGVIVDILWQGESYAKASNLNN